jgi:hypothetical protein
MHRPEQQSVLAAHAFPSVRHAVFRAAQAPPLQVWLQQFPFPVHGWPSEVHDG